MHSSDHLEPDAYVASIGIGGDFTHFRVDQDKVFLKSAVKQEELH